MTVDQLNLKIERAIETLQRGELVIVTDSERREAEGDMVGLAQYVTGEKVNMMVNKARGLLCVPMAEEYAKRLGLTPMISNATDAFGTAFTVSTDAKETSTGISAFDRALTIRRLADINSGWDDFYHPGHIFPLIAKNHGVLERDGHTEAAVDLAKIAGASPVGYICEILKKDGQMTRRKDLKAFAEGMQMPMISIEEIKMYRFVHDLDVAKSITKVKLPTKYGDFDLEAFETNDSNEPTLLISKGEIECSQNILLRIHSECLTGDVLGSMRCDCGEQLDTALREIEANGSGAVIYLRQEGRGIGLANKLKAYKLQEQGYDTVEANIHLGFEPDERHYGLVAAILHKKGIKTVELMTNNPDKINQLESMGIKSSRRAIEMTAHDEDLNYLKTKKRKLNHILKEVN